MLCTRCKKRQAVVFVQRLENGKPVQEGYCLTCARELHIQPVDDLMKRFNMTDDQLASMEEHMADLMQQAQESGAMMPMMDGDMQNPDDTGDDFVPGGSPVFPLALAEPPRLRRRAKSQKTAWPRPAQIPGHLLRKPDPESQGRQAGCHHWP